MLRLLSESFVAAWVMTWPGSRLAILRSGGHEVSDVHVSVKHRQFKHKLLVAGHILELLSAQLTAACQPAPAASPHALLGCLSIFASAATSVPGQLEQIFPHLQIVLSDIVLEWTRRVGSLAGRSVDDIEHALDRQEWVTDPLCPAWLTCLKPVALLMKQSPSIRPQLLR